MRCSGSLELAELLHAFAACESEVLAITVLAASLAWVISTGYVFNG